MIVSTTYWGFIITLYRQHVLKGIRITRHRLTNWLQVFIIITMFNDLSYSHGHPMIPVTPWLSYTESLHISIIIINSVCFGHFTFYNMMKKLCTVLCLWNNIAIKRIIYSDYRHLILFAWICISSCLVNSNECLVNDLV